MTEFEQFVELVTKMGCPPSQIKRGPVGVVVRINDLDFLFDKDGSFLIATSRTTEEMVTRIDPTPEA